MGVAPALVAVVEAAGYGAQLPAARAERRTTRARPDGGRRLRRRLIVSAALAVPCGPALDGPRAAVRLLAVGGPRPRHARRGVGRLAVPPRGLGQPAARLPPRWTPSSRSGSRPPTRGRCTRCCSGRRRRRLGMRMSLRPDAVAPADRRAPTSTSRSPRCVTVFLLAGRYAEARAKRASGAAVRALLDLGRQGRRRRCATGSRRGCRSSALAVGDLFLARPGETRRHRRRRGRGQQRGRRVPADRRDACRSRSARARPSRAPPSTRAGGWSCAPPGWAPTPGWRRSPGSSSRPSPARPPIQRLADRVSAVFVPVVLGDRGAHPGRAGCSRPATPSRRSPQPSRSSSSPARAPSDWPRRPRCSSAPAAARSSAS